MGSPALGHVRPPFDYRHTCTEDDILPAYRNTWFGRDVTDTGEILYLYLESQQYGRGDCHFHTGKFVDRTTEEPEEEPEAPEEEENTPPEVVRRHRDITFPRAGIDPTDRLAWGFTDSDLSNDFRDPDGDALTYSASSSNPGLVRAVVDGSRLTYNAVVGAGTGTATVTVTASDGEDSVSMSFTVVVSSNRPESSRPGNQPEEPENQPEDENSFLDDLLDNTADYAAEEAVEKATERILERASEQAARQVLKTALKGAARAVPVLGAAMTAYDIYTIYQDLTSYDYDSGEQFKRLAENLYIHHAALENGSLAWEQAFSGQEFTVPLRLSRTSSQEGDPSPRFNALFKGNVDFSRFSDSATDFHVDGSSTTYRLGLDVLPNPEAPLVTGVQLAFTRADVDFEDREIDTEGDYALRLFTVSPTVAWDATEHLTLQASISYGRGEAETTIDAIADDRFDFVEGSTTTDSGDLFSVAAGANLRVWQSEASAFHLKLGGSTASFLDTKVQQGRLAAELSRDLALEAGRLRSSANLALLLSNTDPSATELSGNLNWLPAQGRLSGSTTARVLLFGGDRSEWGISGGLSLLPGQQGEGLSLALQPSFGQANASLAGLEGLDAWDRYSDLTDLALGATPLTARFHAEAAYGFRKGNALLTPYTQLDMSDTSTLYGAGFRYALDNSLDLDLSASHRQRSSGNNDNRLFLQLRTDL